MASESAIGEVSQALLSHPQIKERLDRSIGDYAEQRRDELDTLLVAELVEKERDLDKTLASRRQGLETVNKDIARAEETLAQIDDDAQAVRAQVSEDLASVIEDLKHDSVKSLGRDVLIRAVLTTWGSTRRIPPLRGESRRPKDHHHLLHETTKDCTSPQRLEALVGVASMLSPGTLLLSGEYASAWCDYLSRLLGGQNAWTVWCRSDVFGLDDLLRSPRCTGFEPTRSQHLGGYPGVGA